MGLLREGINEIIATTGGNAAPIGIVVRNGNPGMVLFRGSHTSENVETRGWVVANFVFDPVLYVITAFDDLPEGSFVEEQAGGYTVERLASCEAWAAFSATVEKKTRDVLVVGLSLLEESSKGIVLHPVNRGFNSIIEATVHGTRYNRSRSPELLSLIEHHAGIVGKCGGPKEKEALDLLFDYIGYP
ncbi:MAG TPA: DUF447 domain-containing protein [Methanoregulaceae archaeon]|nr:DUF447 domain-containing protein [Methanoregulaceae archaeon]